MLQLIWRWLGEADNVYDLNQLRGKHESWLYNIPLSIYKIAAGSFFTSDAKLSMKDNLYPIAKPFIYL